MTTRKMDSRGKVAVNVRLEPADAARLDMLAASTGGSVKDVVTLLIRGADVTEQPGTVRVITFAKPNGKPTGATADD